MMKKYLLLIVALFITGMGTACQSGPPDPGFRVSTYRTTLDPITGLPVTFSHTNILLSGAWDRDIGTPRGSLTVFLSRNTGSSGYVNVDNGRAPAVWELTEDSGACAGQTIAEEIYPGENEDIYCTDFPTFIFFASPAFIDKTDPPASVTINGQGISTAGGMPNVEYWDSYGNLVGQRQATSVAGDGSWLNGPVPDLSNAGTGTFVVRVKNPDGALAGIAYIDVWYPYIYEPPPPPPGCGGEPLDPRMERPICDYEYSY
ncbi:MAG TPA: hypothetical protein VF666_03455 [Pyrinomonadaceae bacterium]|jgi:hypothetical protein